MAHISRCNASAALLRSQHHNKRAHLHPIVKINHILIGQADATRRNRMSDILRLVRPVDAVQRVLAARVEIKRTRTHWVVRTAFDIIWKRAEPALLTLGRRPSRPLFLASDRGHAGPGLAILAYDCAIADRPAFGQHVVNEASIGIDKDRTWRFVAVVWNNLTLIGGWNRRLPIGWVRQLLPIPRSEICVPLRRPRCLHASAEQQSRPSRYDYDDLHDADPLVLGTRTGRPGDAPIPLCLCKTPAFAIPLPAQSPGEWHPTICRLKPVEGSNVVGQDQDISRCEAPGRVFPGSPHPRKRAVGLPMGFPGSGRGSGSSRKCR